MTSPIAGEREAISHQLKTDPAVFEAVYSGAKTFEIRLNDRDFRVGDKLFLRETKYSGKQIADGLPLEYTGRHAVRTVSHVLSGYGLADGWVCLSFAAALLEPVGEGWQPIETAPAAREDILLISQSGRMSVETGHWARNMLHAAKVDGEECNYTHWMPLPASPKSNGGMGS